MGDEKMVTNEVPFKESMSTSLSREVENWLDIPGYEDSYQVEITTGLVRSLPRRVDFRGGLKTVRGGVIKPRDNGNGYLQVGLSLNGERSLFLGHRLVCLAVYGPPPDALHSWVLHGDGDISNNCYQNLRWGSPRDNTEDSKKHGTFYPGKNSKEYCKRGHEFTESNTYVPPSGGRYCLECRNSRRHLYKRKRVDVND